MTSNSEIEKAMEATLMNLDGKSAEKIDEDKEKGAKEDIENTLEYNIKKRQVDKFRELLQDKVFIQVIILIFCVI
jgi:hypothetical protein